MAGDDTPKSHSVGREDSPGAKVDRRTLLAGTGVSIAAGAASALADVQKADAGESPQAVKSAKMEKPPVGPKLTWKELAERTGLTAVDGRKYHAELPASWDNADWVTKHPESEPDFPSGHEQNEKLKRAIVKAFIESKDIDLTDPNGSPWLLAWRMYPNKDHPAWNKEHEGCGCNCGCFAPRMWPAGDQK